MIQRVAIENHTFDAVPDIQVTLISDVLNQRTSCYGLFPELPVAREGLERSDHASKAFPGVRPHIAALNEQ